MSNLVIVNKFDGGQAEDIRTFSTDQCEETLNFDIFDNPHLLQPYPDTRSETITSGTLTDHKLADVVETTGYLSSNVSLIALGEEGAADSSPEFFSNDYSLNGSWSPSATEGTNTVRKGTLVEYKGLAFAIKAGSTAGEFFLLELTTLSIITNRNSGTPITPSDPTANPCRPFVHPEDNVLYMGVGNSISKWDGTTFTQTTTLLPTNFTTTSLANYGGYLVIAGRIGNKSIVYLWGRDMTLNTLQGVIDFGEGRLNVIENIGEVLVGVMMTSNTNFVIDNKVMVKVWAGGTVETIKRIDIPSSVGSTILKAKNKSRLFFALTATDCIYSVGKNKEGQWAVAKDRFIYNGGIIGSRFDSFSVIEDMFFAGFSAGSSTGLFYRTKKADSNPNVSSDFSSESSYTTTVNPSMSLADRYKDKQLQAVQISISVPVSGNFGEIRVLGAADGNAFAEIINEDVHTAGEYIFEATNQFDGAFPEGREFQFKLISIGGVQIKEIRYRYSVLNSQL